MSVQTLQAESEEDEGLEKAKDDRAGNDNEDGL
jgi:hypothetical protein